MKAEREYPRFSDEEYRRRYQAVREGMARQELDGLLLFGAVGIHGSWQANIHYLSNYADTHYHSYLLFPREAAPTLFITIYPHVPHARRISVVEDTRWGGWDEMATVAGRIRELGGDRWHIGLVGPSSFWKIAMPFEHYQQLTAALPHATFTPCTRLLEEIRMIKSAEEIAALERAAAYTDMAMEAAAMTVRPGAYDYEVVAALRHAYQAAGGTFSFELFGSTPMAQPDMPYPWKSPLYRQLRPGDLVVTEISAAYNYYAGQIIRPIAVGKPLPIYERLFEVALLTHQRVAAALRPGNTERDVVQALAPIRDAGFEVHAPVIHGWAQGIGEPFAGLPERQGWPVTPVTFQAGMTVMIEPNPVAPDQRHGIFLGNLHVITPDGARNLQRFPTEFIAVSARGQRGARRSALRRPGGRQGR